MVRVYFNNQSIPVPHGKSVLQTLLDEGESIPYSCQSGVCHSCLMVAEAGQVPGQARQGLTREQVANGLFLSCSCYPDYDLTVSRFDPSGATLPATVTGKRLLHRDVMELTLRADMNYEAGQYLTLWRDSQTARSFSLASIPSDRDLAFHIRVREDGQFSHWAHTRLLPGDTLEIQGPMGDCTYQADSPDQPLLLAGTGTGIAPLYGIARQALAEGHTGPIHLVMAARQSDGFYFTRPLEQLAHNHANLTLTLVAQQLSARMHGPALQADVYQHLKGQFPQLRDYQVFLCGAESFVAKMRKQCFLSGVRPRNVHADAFVAS